MWNLLLSACSRIASSSRLNPRLVLPALVTVVFALPTAGQAAPLPTTTLTLSSSTVASPAEVTLTATVVSGGTPVVGTVIFCDASAALCEDAAIVGKVQLVAGTATLRIIPAIGIHTYKALYRVPGTTTSSTSAPQQLTVTGLYATTTTVTATGNPSGYGLTATVVGFASQPPILAGSVTFQDTTDNNTLLGIVPLSPPIFAQTLVQAPGSPVRTGNAPTVAVVGDFNEDGIPDLAVVNGEDDSISILLGKGDGTFSSPTLLPVFGTSACASNSIQSNCAIAAADFNQDGHTDLAVTSGFDNTVTVFKGNGQGAFTQFGGSPILVGNYPEAIKTGDFNNDGIQDLAVANANDDDVSILLGNGDGTFTPAGGSPVSVGIGNFPFFIAVADFNNDGNTDLGIVTARDSSLTILEGNGDGTFTPFAGSPYIFANQAGSGGVVAADFNHDGNADLAVANFNTNDVEILLGNGDGTFAISSQSPITVGTNPFALVALDYNSDGYTDLAVANFTFTESPGTLTLLMGQGNGFFQLPGASFPLGQFPNDVVTADFNGDGKPDLAIPDFGSLSTTILLNQVTQTATASLQNVVLPGEGPKVVEASYPANTAFAASSGTVTLQGEFIPTTLTLTAVPTQQLDTMAVTFTAQLAPVSNLVPTGTITFFDQSVGVQLASVAINAAGQAGYTTSSLGDGTHLITASYTGDTIYRSSTSAALSITISDLRVTRVGNNNTTILPGTTVVYTLQVEPQVIDTFLYNVALSATGLPAGATVTFSPAIMAGGKTTTVTMTIETSKTALNAPPPSPFGRLPLALGLLLPLLGASGVRRQLRRLPATLGVLLLAALSLTAVAGLSGCAGAGLFAARKVAYPITVTATEGTLQRSVEVPLAIQ